METTSEAGRKILDCASALGLTLTSVFVPWSKSRNAKEKHPSLNWRVTLLRDGREILTTDFGAGCAYAPSYNDKGARTADGQEMIRWECENGRQGKRWAAIDRIVPKGDPILPALEDVLYSLSADAEALNAGTFEAWACEFGYDTDSRKAEATYRACLDIALRLRSAIGEDGLAKIQEACRDY